MRISDLSRLTGVSIRSLRYYEEKELLSPTRTESGYREYEVEDVERVRKIQFYLQLGVRTEELAHLFHNCAGFPGNGNPSCAEDAIAFYESKLLEIRRQKQLLETAERDINHIIAHWEEIRQYEPIGKRGSKQMLMLDHVTFAVRDLDATVHKLTKETGVRFSAPVEAIPGARGQVAYLGKGFLEVIAEEDSDKLRNTELGTGFAEFAERQEGIFGVALEVSGGLASFIDDAKERGVPYIGPFMQQAPLSDGLHIQFGTALLGYDMPWLIEYEQSRAWDSPFRLSGIEVSAANLSASAQQYRQVYHLSAPVPIGEAAYEWQLDRGEIRLIQQEQGQPGFSAVTIADKEREYRIEFVPEAGMTITQSSL